MKQGNSAMLKAVAVSLRENKQELADLMALELANDTEYGLGASIWTSSQVTIDRAIETLESGQIAVNGIVKSDPRLPSGGIGKSGYGRELGPQGIREFVNVQ
ncbi:aldehyde dehydrogenase family protein [Marinomonas pontica]|jgi:succinate-semialdehyde dehydrogenase / glutarate-semialdehyde dehydrogenase|uniref:aldehyde dehydrogenase family protein n=1 Tax=Marinomonas pontica TaxID=264739 RepID=UPI00224381F5|nr:aldehyde dehydrogenase family protein [Marinomonas pontica]MCW8357115.1 aldehyde dehydrogenase family protein [Marinomonas pontica]